MACCAAIGWGMAYGQYPMRPVDLGGVAAMVLSATLAGVVSALVWVWGRAAPEVPFGRRDAVFAVVAIWIGSSALGGLPYVIGAGLSPVDAFFETASGLTTTGATIVADIEGTLSYPLLLWRSLTQWLGGMGIVVLFVAVFPNLGVSAKHMFRSEVPGVTAEGLVPRITETSLTLWKLYAGFTLVLTFILYLLGMNLFEAVNHAMTTMSTGGFSTRNASISGFESPAIEGVVTLFMLAAGVNFGLYYGILVSRRPGILMRSIEFRAYLGIVLVLTVLLTLALRSVYGDFVTAFRYAFFAVGTYITSTGFVTSDQMTYPPVAHMLIIGLMFVGACAGSTSGGMKVSRLVILLEVAWVQLRRSVRPAVVQVVRLDRKVLEDSVQLEVGTFFVLYLLAIGAFTLAVCTLEPVQVPTAFGAVLTCVSNMGPALWYEGADNFAGYSDATKLLFSFAMILGRLELFTVLALLVPDVWRR